MDFNFRNPRAIAFDRLRGRERLSREEEEALKEQRHRQALALLEVARQQQNTPPGAGGPLGGLGRSIGEQQIDDRGATAVNALGLAPGKISNGGFASLQRNAPAAPALGLELGQRDFGGAQTVSNQPVDAAFSSSGGAAVRPLTLNEAIAENEIHPGVGEAILIGDGSTRIVTLGGAVRQCRGDAESAQCSVSYDPDSPVSGVVVIQVRGENGKWQIIDDSRVAVARRGWDAVCSASRDNPGGQCSVNRVV